MTDIFPIEVGCKDFITNSTPFIISLLYWPMKVQLAGGAIEYTDCTSAEGQDTNSSPSLPDKCLGYDIKQFDGETPVMPKLWGMQSTPSLPWLSGPLWLQVVTPDRILSMGQIEIFDI